MQDVGRHDVQAVLQDNQVVPAHGADSRVDCGVGSEQG